jgi:sRNA-binding carbon storage regulator CsrA
VYRHEIWLAIKEENAAAALAPASSVPTDIPPS